MRAKVLGWAVSESRNKTIGTCIALEIEFDDYRQQTALKCAGHDCTQEYIRGDYSSILEVGRTVQLVYGKGFQGKAVLQEIVPLDN